LAAHALSDNTDDCHGRHEEDQIVELMFVSSSFIQTFRVYVKACRTAFRE